MRAEHRGNRECDLFAKNFGESAEAQGHSAQREIVAFDTGPGNMLIDAWVGLATDGRERFDRGGRHAARGALDQVLLRELRGHPYFRQRPPKSTGREAFGAEFARGLYEKHAVGRGVKMDDLLHTATRLTAWSIADAYARFLPALPKEVILCGGGAQNPTLVRMLAEELARVQSDADEGTTIRLRQIDELGIPNKAKEAASFALLAAATLDGVPANLPSVTGAARGVVLGVIARPGPR